MSNNANNNAGTYYDNQYGYNYGDATANQQQQQDQEMTGVVGGGEGAGYEDQQYATEGEYGAFADDGQQQYGDTGYDDGQQQQYQQGADDGTAGYYAEGYQQDGGEYGGADYGDQNPMQEFYEQPREEEGGKPLTAQQQEGGQNVVEDKREKMKRTWKYEDYEPVSNGYFADICTEVFVSYAFKCYFCIQLYSVSILTFFIGVDFCFSTLFRIFVPPVDDKPAFWQSMAYFAIFFPFSYLVTAFFCLVMDMIKSFWAHTREDTMFWGFTHSKTKPPWIVHGLLVFLTLILPIFWSLILTASKKRTVLYFCQFFFFIGTVITMFIFVVMFVWLYFRALREKKRAYGRRLRDEDLPEKHKKPGEENTTNNVRKSWMASDIVLEEYGLDSRTISWCIVVYTVGLIPLFVMYVVIAQQGIESSPNAGWTVIGLIFFCLLLLLQQLSNAKKRKDRSVVAALLMMALIVILGFIGCGSSGNGVLFAIYIGMLFAAQLMLLRKRNHELTRKEICLHLGVEITKEEDEMKQDNQIDSYLCCCKKSIFACFTCMDIKTTFGYKHPDVSAVEKRLRRERLALRSDHKVLLSFWVLSAIAACAILAMGQQMMVKYELQLAQRGTAVPPQTFSGQPVDFCSMNTNGGKTGPYDLALMSVLGYSYGPSWTKDFNTWFGHIDNLQLVHPSKIPTNEAEASDSHKVRFFDVVDRETNFHYIVIRNLLQGTTWMRTVDVWGESMAFQVASVFAPTLAIWPYESKVDFVDGLGFLKKIYDSSRTDGGQVYLDDIEDYISNLRDTFRENQNEGKNHTGDIVLVGHGFNGGMAKIIALRKRVTAFVFNSPGVGYLRDRFLLLNDMKRWNRYPSHVKQLNLVRNVPGYIDDKENDVAHTEILPCSETTNGFGCTDVRILAQKVLEACGDTYGRSVRQEGPVV